MSSFQTWECEVIPLYASPLAYRAPGSTHVVVLLPSSALGCYSSLYLLLSGIIINCKLIFILLLFFLAPGITVVPDAASSGQAQLEPVPEETEVVEESEANPVSQSDSEGEVKEVNSPTPSISVSASQLFLIPEDDVVDKYVLGLVQVTLSNLKLFISVTI